MATRRWGVLYGQESSRAERAGSASDPIVSARELLNPRAARRKAAPYTSFTFFNGSVRTGLPVAAKMALSTAGVTTEIVGSPTPPQKSPDGTMTVSTF